MPIIISEDTTWSSAGVITLTDEVQIAPGVTLTIADGATIVGNGYAIRAYGSLVAGTTQGPTTSFRDVAFLFGDDFRFGGRIEIAGAKFFGGSFLQPTGNGSYGSFSVTDSKFIGVNGFYIWYPVSDSVFAGNIFENSAGLSVGVNSSGSLTILNNTFVRATAALNGESTIVVWANYSSLDAISVLGNNFLDGLSTHLEVALGYDSSKLFVSRNYFENSTPALVESVILDRQDSLSRASDIESVATFGSPSTSAPSVGQTLVRDVSGAGTNDNLVGGLGDDSIYGLNGDDRLTGNAGNDYLDGGVGFDTAVYVAGSRTISISVLKDGVMISDRSGAEGIDLLSGVESIRFSDLTWSLASFDDSASLSEASFVSLAEMYIAYFNRAPDSQGLLFWADSLAQGVSLESIAAAFFASAEASAAYPDRSNILNFVETVYNNVLGRPSDAGGLAYWVDILERGITSPEAFIVNVLDAAKAHTTDRVYLENKTDVGIYFSAIKGISDGVKASEVMNLYDGSPVGILAAKELTDDYHATATSVNGGEFLVNLIGVVSDPFADMAVA